MALQRVPRTLSGRVRADLELQKVTIEFDRFGKMPTVVMEGRILTKRPSVGQQSEVVIRTRHLGPMGQAWITEMRDAFAADVPVSKGVDEA